MHKDFPPNLHPPFLHHGLHHYGLLSLTSLCDFVGLLCARAKNETLSAPSWTTTATNHRESPWHANRISVGQVSRVGTAISWVSIPPIASIQSTLFHRPLESDIIHVNVAGTCMIIINSLEVLIDLLEKRGALYSSRYIHSVLSWPARVHKSVIQSPDGHGMGAHVGTMFFNVSSGDLTCLSQGLRLVYGFHAIRELVAITSSSFPKRTSLEECSKVPPSAN